MMCNLWKGRENNFVHEKLIYCVLISVLVMPFIFLWFSQIPLCNSDVVLLFNDPGHNSLTI